MQKERKIIKANDSVKKVALGNDDKSRKVEITIEVNKYEARIGIKKYEGNKVCEHVEWIYKIEEREEKDPLTGQIEKKYYCNEGFFDHINNEYQNTGFLKIYVDNLEDAREILKEYIEECELENIVENAKNWLEDEIRKKTREVINKFFRSLNGVRKNAGNK